MKKLLLIALLIVGCDNSTEAEDCAGVAGGSATNDDCGNCSETWSGSGDIDNGNDVFIAYNEKYGKLEGIEF